MHIQFHTAARKRAKARIALQGPSGSGKTYAALLIAKGIGGKIAAIDTENGSMSLYADLVPFDVLELQAPYTPERYIEAMHAAEKAGYDIIIMDSITHEWNGKGGLLEIHGNMPGNSWANWKSITPRHQKFIDAMIQSSCHVIATMRSKTEYLQTEDKGKTKIQKAGSAPQQRDGMDYEFTLCLDIQQSNHVASASKDRTSLWDARYEKITVEHGEEIKKWLDGGQVVKEKSAEKKKTPPKASKNATKGKDTKVEEKAPPAAPNDEETAKVTGKMLADQRATIRQLYKEAGLKSAEEVKGVVSGLVGKEVGSTDALSYYEGLKVIDGLRGMILDQKETSGNA